MENSGRDPTAQDGPHVRSIMKGRALFPPSAHTIISNCIQGPRKEDRCSNEDQGDGAGWVALLDGRGEDDIIE